MTQSLFSTSDKHRAIDLIEQIIHLHCWTGLNATQRLAINDYYAWMRHNSRPLQSNVKLEIDPNPQVLRLTLEYSFDAIPPWGGKQS